MRSQGERSASGFEGGRPGRGCRLSTTVSESRVRCGAVGLELGDGGNIASEGRCDVMRRTPVRACAGASGASLNRGFPTTKAPKHPAPKVDLTKRGATQMWTLDRTGQTVTVAAMRRRRPWPLDSSRRWCRANLCTACGRRGYQG